MKPNHIPPENLINKPQMNMHAKVKYLDIDENFYIENDIVKVKTIKCENTVEDGDDELESIWATVKKIILKVKEYDELNGGI